jgi:hypothetical protein
VEPVRIPVEVLDRTAAALEQMSRRFAALEEQAKAIGDKFAQIPQAGGSGGGLPGLGGQAESLFGKLSGVAFGFNNIIGAVQNLAAAARPAFDFLIGSNEKLNAQLLSSQTNLASATRIFQGGKEVTDPTAKIQASQGALRAALKQVEVDTQSLVGVTSQQINELFQTTLQNAAALNNQSKQFPQPIEAATSLTKGWAASLKVIGVPLFQAGQEINSILRGQIDQNSMLAKNLNITNEQVNKWKSQGILVDELNKRLNVFVSGNAIASRSIEGISSNIQDIVEVLGREVGAPFLEPIVDILDQLYQALNSNREAVTEFAKDVAGKLLEAFNQVKEIAAQFQPALSSLAGAFVSLAQAGIDIFINSLQAFLTVLGGVAAVVAPVLAVIANLVKMIADLGNTPIGQFVVQAGLLVVAVATIGPVVAAMGAAIAGFAAAIPAVLAGLSPLIAAAATTAAPFIAAGVAIAALVAVFQRIAPELEPVKQGFADLFDRLGTALAPAIDALRQALGQIGEAVGRVLVALAPLAGLIGGALAGAVRLAIAALTPFAKAWTDLFVGGVGVAANFVGVAIKAISSLAQAIADSPIGKIIGALLNQLGKLVGGGEAATQKPDLSGVASAYIELGEKAKGALGELGKAGDGKAATAAAQKLIDITKQQIEKGVITVDQGQKQLSAIIGNNAIDEAVRKQAASISQGLGQSGGAADELAKKAEGAARELQGSAQKFADYQSAINNAKQTLTADVVDPAQAQAAAESIVKATKTAFEGRVITAEQAKQQIEAVLNNPNADNAIKAKAQELQSQIDAAAQSGKAATEQQVQAIQKAGSAIAEAGELEIKGKEVDDLGTTFEQLAKKAANAQKVIEESGSGDPTRLNAAFKEVTDLTKQQLELGQITEAEAEKRLSAIANNKKAEVGVQQAATQQLTAIKEAAGKKEQELLNQEIQNIEEAVATGKKSRVEGEEEITRLKFEQLQKQLQNLRNALKAEEAAGRGNGKRAQELKSQIEKAETDVAKSEESARKQRYDNRLKLAEEADKTEIANIKERIAQGLVTEEEGERQLLAQRQQFAQQRLQVLRENLQAEIAAGRGGGDLAKNLKTQIEQSETEAAEAQKAAREGGFKASLKQIEDAGKSEQTAIKIRIANEQITEAEGQRQLTQQRIAAAQQRIKIIQQTLAAEEAAGRGKGGFAKSLREQAQSAQLEIAEANKAAREAEKAAREKTENDRKQKREEATRKEQEAQDKVIRQLERSQSEAMDALKLAQTERETELVALLGKGLAREVEIGEERAVLKRQQIDLELQQERDKLAALEALPPLSDPDREAERQAKIRASRQKTAELTISLIQAEAAIQDAIVAKVKDRIDQEIKGIQNRQTAFEQAANRELQLQGFIEKAIDRQNKLIQSRKGLFDALKSYSEGEYNLALQFTENQDEQQRIREELAGQRLQFLSREQEFERQSLELELKKNAALRQREEIQNRIEQARAKADFAKETANLEKARIDLGRGKITQADFDAAALSQDAARQQVEGAIEQGALLKEQAEVDRQTEANQRKAQAAKFALATDQARAELAKETKTKSDDQALQREFLGKARSGAQQTLLVPVKVADRPPIVSKDAIAQQVKAATDNTEMLLTLRQFEASVKEGVRQLLEKPVNASIQQNNTFTGGNAATDKKTVTKQLYNDLYDLSQYAKRKN